MQYHNMYLLVNLDESYLVASALDLIFALGVSPFNALLAY